ncbi:MAG TPA: pyruvate dehydrogenase (acetyl-transferring), homodimeric type [Streptosporangiaceae bacterium]|nr:pyruvate dehydrogenase (acetyl-transferring), homodimeric type [Streptosporangiaceae bacterium]
MLEDLDPAETREWVDALDSVMTFEGADRAFYLLDEVIAEARRKGAPVPYSATTPYLNTIPPDREDRLSPHELSIDHRIRSLIRWNALAIVLRANAESSELGGHIASFQSAATLYDVGFQHFFHAPNDRHAGDLLFIQGHSSPGIYARSFVEGRLTEDQLKRFRMEVDGGGLASYPHPWLMPDYWQMPTVSMGLGPIMGIYQARFLKYLASRGLADTSGRKVWVFLGDGETDEPESLGAIALASREKLDNLIFVINCNLQRLDGPVRGNGKIIQELEGIFRGAGWNVIKTIWGGGWDPLIARDSTGVLLKRMEECVDGEYQDFKSKNGAHVRDRFFGKYPDLLEMVAGMTDDEIWALNRGGHDPNKVYAAYSAAVRTVGQPTVILAKTIKGYGMGESGEGQNITHQQKHMASAALVRFRDRFDLPLTDGQLAELPFLRFSDDSPEMAYLRERRDALGGSLPARRRRSTQSLTVPALSAFGGQLGGTPGREISTTMAFVRVLNTLLRDRQIGKRVVPIVADESRTFGMEGMFRQFGIFSQAGQLYQPEDASRLMYYREAPDGQMLQEGINEAGAMASWIAAATAYSTSDVPMIPFYIFYSMFGFQRVMDLAWAAADSRARGFLLGGTSGRTTLNGEGLQHEDGHSHVLAAVIPSCVSYDPTYSYEVAVIVQEGLRRMFAEQEDVFFYITLMNENYEHPALPEGAEAGILKGMYLLREGSTEAAAAAGGETGVSRVQLLGSGTILREVLAAADLLAADYGITADVWSAPSFTELRRDGLATQRWNMLHPTEPPRRSYVETCLAGRAGPVVAATDYVKSFADQIRPFVPQRYRVLGTDGFGRSDYRRNLRRFFEVDRHYVALAALASLAEDGTMPAATVADAISRYGIDAGKPDPATA